MTTHSKRTAAIYLATVFVAGSMFGFAASQFYNSVASKAPDGRTTPQEYRQKLLNELDAQLNLDDDQETEILAILDDVGERFHAVRDAMDPEFDAIRKERGERIMALLTPEQSIAYEKILAERRRKRELKAAEHQRKYHQQPNR